MDLQETKQQNQTSTQVHESKIFPFLIVEKKDFNEQNSETSCTCQIALQNSIVCEKTFNSIDEAEEYISKPQWDLIINLICLTFETLQKYENKN